MSSNFEVMFGGVVQTSAASGSRSQAPPGSKSIPLRSKSIPAGSMSTPPGSVSTPPGSVSTLHDSMPQTLPDSLSQASPGSMTAPLAPIPAPEEGEEGRVVGAGRVSVAAAAAHGLYTRSLVSHCNISQRGKERLCS